MKTLAKTLKNKNIELTTIREITCEEARSRIREIENILEGIRLQILRFEKDREVLKEELVSLKVCVNLENE